MEKSSRLESPAEVVLLSPPTDLIRLTSIIEETFISLVVIVLVSPSYKKYPPGNTWFGIAYRGRCRSLITLTHQMDPSH